MYEDKIISSIKSKMKIETREILSNQAEKIISDFNLLEGGALIPGQSPIQLSKFRENLNIVDGVPTTDRADRLASFLSQHHFIEPNRS